jgi:predicted acyl esterase
VRSRRPIRFREARGITISEALAMTGRYEMLVEQNAEVPMRDGAILRANVYRPDADARFPVLMTFGPYGKDVPLREFMKEAWDRLNQTYPEILAASSCKHLVFERPDPEVWVLQVTGST